jgi:hypothetical protein
MEEGGGERLKAEVTKVGKTVQGTRFTAHGTGGRRG